MLQPTQDIFELVLARPVLTPAGEDPVLVHLWWRTKPAALGGGSGGSSGGNSGGLHLVQVYVNGELVEVTQHVLQRELFLMLDRRQPQRIELLAVGADQAEALWQPRPELLAGWTPPVRAEAAVALLRQERLPVDTQITVRQGQQVLDQGPLWAADEPRGGFGALFGLGEFGRDALTGPGVGEGELGLGPLGADGAAWRWRRTDLGPGAHDLEIAAHDGCGRAVAQTAGVRVELNQLPAPARELTLSREFVLSWME